MCQGFSPVSCFSHHFVLGELATSSIRIKTVEVLRLKLGARCACPLCRGGYPAEGEDTDFALVDSIENAFKGDEHLSCKLLMRLLSAVSKLPMLRLALAFVRR